MCSLSIECLLDPEMCDTLSADEDSDEDELGQVKMIFSLFWLVVSFDILKNEQLMICEHHFFVIFVIKTRLLVNCLVEKRRSLIGP